MWKTMKTGEAAYSGFASSAHKLKSRQQWSMVAFLTYVLVQAELDMAAWWIQEPLLAVYMVDTEAFLSCLQGA